MKSDRTFRFFGSLIRPHIGWLILLCLGNFIAALLSVGLALVSRNVIDSVHGGVSGTLVFWCCLLAGTVITQFLLNAGISYIRSLLHCRLDITLKSRIFRSYIGKSYRDASRYHSGEILNRLTSDVDVVIGGVSDLLPSVISIVTRLAASLVVLILFNWIFALIVLAVGIAGALAARYAGKYYKKMHKTCQESSGALRSFMQESSENLVVVKTFSDSAPVEKRLHNLMKTDYRNKMKRTRVAVIFNSIASFLFNGSYYVALAWGAVQVGAAAMSFGDLTAFLQIISQVRTPFLSMSGVLTRYYASIASAERLLEIENLTDDPLPAPCPAITSGRIRLDHLSFSYDKKPTLTDCNASIELGKITTIVGESGSGKSTLFRLLLGLYQPTDGRLLLCGDDGTEQPVDATVRRLFTYVPQGNFVLTGTIRENVTFFNDGISDERVMEALRAADLDSFVATLPDGLDTAIKERGSGLSEGQIQRIAIARALLFDAPILLLDECTSALDEGTEARILENIKHLNGKTVIFVTHRMRALDISDHVLRVVKTDIRQER